MLDGFSSCFYNGRYETVGMPENGKMARDNAREDQKI